MPVDVQNFITPEDDFRGLHVASNTIERENEREDMLARQRQGQKASSMSFLSNYLDPKDHLTGTNYDPQIVAGFDNLLQEGAKLANEGADTNMIMMALSPKVAKLNQYSTTAKLISQRIKDQLSQIPNNSGYDKKNLEQVARKTAFYDNDGNLKDIESIDPNTDWLTESIKLYPEQVTNDAAIDEFVKNSPKFVNTQRVKRTNSKGGYELRRSKVTAPNWSTVDDAGEIVPKFDVATNDGEIMYSEDGKTPIRLMNEGDFNSVLKSNPGIADWLRGQLRMAGESTNLNTPQAKNAARAIMYQELKRRGGGGIEDIEEVKENPAPRISIRVGSGSGELNINDVYKDVVEKTDDPQTAINLGGKRIGTRMNSLSADAQRIIFNLFGGRKDDLNETNTFINKDDSGVVRLYKVNDEGVPEVDKKYEVGIIPKTGTNLNAQPGINEKRKVIEEGNKNTSSGKTKRPSLDSFIKK